MCSLYYVDACMNDHLLLCHLGVSRPWIFFLLIKADFILEFVGMHQ